MSDQTAPLSNFAEAVKAEAEDRLGAYADVQSGQYRNYEAPELFKDPEDVRSELAAEDGSMMSSEGIPAHAIMVSRLRTGLLAMLYRDHYNARADRLMRISCRLSELNDTCRTDGRADLKINAAGNWL